MFRRRSVNRYGVRETIDTANSIPTNSLESEPYLVVLPAEQLNSFKFAELSSRNAGRSSRQAPVLVTGPTALHDQDPRVVRCGDLLHLTTPTPQ